MVIQSRPPEAPPSWTPEWTWNPSLDTRFPDSTHAETLVRTANEVRRTQSRDAFWEPTNTRGTISAYLGAFCEPALREIFCAPVSSFNVAMVDQGKIVCCSILPIYAIGRRLCSALLKNMICE